MKPNGSSNIAYSTAATNTMMARRIPGSLKLIGFASPACPIQSVWTSRATEAIPIPVAMTLGKNSGPMTMMASLGKEALDIQI